MKNFKQSMLASILNGTGLDSVMNQGNIIEQLKREAVDALEKTVEAPINSIGGNDFYDQLLSVEEMQKFSELVRGSNYNGFYKSDLIGDMSIDGMGTE